MKRRTLLTTGLAVGGAGAAGLLRPGRARAQTVVGVTDKEIKIGNTDAYSGPASAYGVIAKCETAFFKMINDQGGVNGRMINFISYDDGYSPPKTVEQVRRLIEEDQVACLFNTLGTPTNSAIERYVNQKKVPMLFVSTGADKWGNYKQFPWTIGYQPSYRTEAQIYTKYMLQEKPDAKMAILYQNDDFGKDYPIGVRDALGDRFDKVVVTQATYEVTDPTLDSQINSIQAAGADVLLTAATPKFAAMVIKKLADMNWKPLHFMTNVSISVGAVMKPAGPENGIGIITTGYMKDPTDPAWKDDPGMNEWRAFMAKYIPDGDTTDANYSFAYGVSQVMMQTLKQCGNDLSRENILKQAKSLQDLALPTAMPGITINTSATSNMIWTQLQLQRWTGANWEQFGEVLDVKSE